MRRRSFDAVCTAELAALRAEPDDDAGWLRADAVSGDVLAEARRLLGTPYEWGGLSERGIDCSGLVHVAFRRAGTLVPRDAHEQEEAGTEIAEAELRPGDLVTYGAEAADHIAFWLGGGEVLHSRGGVGVVEELEPEDLRAPQAARPPHP